MESKKWFFSKTLWANAVSVAAMVLQGITGKEIIDPAAQGVALGLVNIVLRLLTRKEVAW